MMPPTPMMPVLMPPEVHPHGTASPRFRTIGTSYITTHPSVQHWMEADSRTGSRGFRTVLDARAPR